MEGPVDWGTLGWIGTVVGACVTGAFAIWFFIDRSIKAAVTGMRQDIGDRIDEMGARVGAAAGLASLADKAVAELRAHIAENYVTKDALVELVEGNREIRQSIGGVHERLDKVIMEIIAKR